MKAVAYCRVSRDTEEQLNSLENQISHYTALFASKGYDKVPLGIFYQKDGNSQILTNGIFADEGISGTKLKNRQAFQLLMRYAEDKEFDIIFCKNVPRFARNIVDGQNALKRLKQLGINVMFEDGGLNYFEHEDIINIFLSMAQSESRMKSGACKFGIRKAQESGKWTSNCPYGYNREDGYLQVNMDEAGVVKKIFDLYTKSGYGHNRIVKYLLDNAVVTKKGGAWYQQHIKGILSNPIYIGKQINHKSENMDINVKNIVDVDESEWISHDFEALRIIDDETWQKAQDINKNNFERYSMNGKRNSSVNLFSTVCICANCGGVMKRKRKRTKKEQKMVYLDTYEWVCQNNDMYGKRKCDFRNAIDENILVQFTKEHICGYREHKDILKQRLDMYIETYFTFDTTEKISLLESKIETEKNDFKNKTRLNGLGIVSDEEIRDYSKEYRKTINELEQQLRKFRNLDKEVEEVKRKYSEFVSYLDNIDVEKLTNTDLKKIFHQIEIGTYGIGQIHIHEINRYIDLSKYIWLSNDKKSFKGISAEHLFMNIEEGKIIMDALEKSWIDELIGYEKEHGIPKWKSYEPGFEEYP